MFQILARSEASRDAGFALIGHRPAGRFDLAPAADSIESLTAGTPLGLTVPAIVPAGTYDLEVRPAGTEDVALELPGVTLEAGMTHDVFAIGLVEDGSLNVLVVPSMTGAMIAG